MEKDHDPVGALGEGRGPFVFASASSIGYPMLQHVRFTCTDALYEGAVGQILEEEHDLEQVIRALLRAGFEVEPASYDELFPDVTETPLDGPEVDLEPEAPVFGAAASSERSRAR